MATIGIQIHGLWCLLPCSRSGARSATAATICIPACLHVAPITAWRDYPTSPEVTVSVEDGVQIGLQVVAPWSMLFAIIRAGRRGQDMRKTDLTGAMILRCEH